MKRVFPWAFAAIVLLPLHGWARTPSAWVVEVASGSAEVPLAACDGIHVRRGEVVWSDALSRWLARRSGSAPDWHARQGLRRVEDVGTVLMLRSPDFCRLLLSDRSAGRLPGEWKTGAFAAFGSWHAAADAFCLEGDVSTCIAPREHRVLPLPSSAQAPLRLYHHGRMEAYLGWRPPGVRAVGPDQAVSVHLEGPGDEARFLVSADRAGTLVVERTPGFLPDLNLLMGSGEEDLELRGSVSVAAGGQALVVFRYQGMEPLRLDAGFLFTPDPFSCAAWILSADGPRLDLRLSVVNQTARPRAVTRPSGETLEWRRQGEVVAAARPGRLPATVLLPPGGRLEHLITLVLPEGVRPDEAVLSQGDWELHCPLRQRSP